MQRDIIAEFHDALMDFMDHFKEEAEAQAENIIRDPAEMLSTLLYETLADHSDKRRYARSHAVIFPLRAEHCNSDSIWI